MVTTIIYRYYFIATTTIHYRFFNEVNINSVNHKMRGIVINWIPKTVSIASQLTLTLW